MRMGLKILGTVKSGNVLKLNMMFLRINYVGLMTVNGISLWSHYPSHHFTSLLKLNSIQMLKEKVLTLVEVHKRLKVNKKSKLLMKKEVLIFLQKHLKILMLLANSKSLKIILLSNLDN